MKLLVLAIFMFSFVTARSFAEDGSTSDQNLVVPNFNNNNVYVFSDKSEENCTKEGSALVDELSNGEKINPKDIKRIYNVACKDIREELEKLIPGLEKSLEQNIETNKEIEKTNDEDEQSNNQGFNIKDGVIAEKHEKTCFEGNALFKQACNAFNGNQIIKNRNFLNAANMLLFTDENISKMNSTTGDCDACMGRAHDKFTGKENFQEDKLEIDNIIKRRLKVRKVVPAMLELSGAMESALEFQALYSKSIQIGLNKMSSSENFNQDKFEKSLYCLDSEEILNQIDTSCAVSDFELEMAGINSNDENAIKDFQTQKIKDAKQILGEGLLRLKLDGKDLQKSLEGLQNRVASRNNSLCDGMKRSLIDYKIRDYAGYREIEKSLGENSDTFKMFSFLEKTLKEDTKINHICSELHEGKLVDEVIKSNPEKFYRHKIEYPNKKYLEKTKNIYGELSKNFIDNNGKMTFSKVLQKAAKYDPSIRFMFSSWEELCHQKDQLSKNEGAKLKDIVRGKEPNSKEDFHDKNFQNLIRHAKFQCQKQYKKIAKGVCSTENYPKANAYDYDKIAGELFKELDQNAKNSGDSNDALAKKIALGAIRCSAVAGKTVAELEIRDPLRGFACKPLIPSSYAMQEAKDQIEGDHNLSDIIGFYKDDDVNDKNYCNEDNIAMNKGILVKMIYGDEIDDDVALDFYRDNVDLYSDDYEFNKKMADNYFPNDKKLHEKIESFNKKRTPIHSVASSAGAISPSNEIHPINNYQPLTDMNAFQNQQQMMNKALNQKAREALHNFDEVNSPDEVNDIANAWEKEKTEYLKKIADLENRLKSKLDNPSELPKSGNGSVSDLEDQIAALENNKKTLLEKDKVISQMKDVTKEKNKIDKKLAAASLGNRDEESVDTARIKEAGRSVASNRAASYVPGPSYNANRVPKSNYQSGIGGYIHTQDAKDAVLSLVQVKAALENGDLQVEFIKVGDTPKFIKIPGITSYIDISKLNDLILADPDQYGFLKKYIQDEQLAKIEKMAKVNNEVLVANLAESIEPAARLSEMKAALEFSKLQLSNIKNNTDEADLHLENVKKYSKEYSENRIK